jgi:hypothetical protein
VGDEEGVGEGGDVGFEETVRGEGGGVGGRSGVGAEREEGGREEKGGKGGAVHECFVLSNDREFQTCR